ncbi:pentapeptide repeat-containing protein [Niabella agricola]|uniref:pentapeptide repeat-containing protein n=1 Tax=Niabella agricola TaxID=2891571 RepID=UPI0038733536
MKVFCHDDRIIEVPYDSLTGVSLDNLNLHRAQLESIDLSNSSFENANLRGLFYLDRR